MVGSFIKHTFTAWIVSMVNLLHLLITDLYHVMDQFTHTNSGYLYGDG